MKILLAILALTLPCAAATLLWDANTETNLAGYKIYHGTNSRQYLVSTNSTTNTTFTLTNLVNGTNYFAVTAFDTDGLESEYSDEVFLVWTNRPAKVRSLRFAPTLNAQSAPAVNGPWSPEFELGQVDITDQARFFRLALALPAPSAATLKRFQSFEGSKGGAEKLLPKPKRPRQGLPFPPG